MKLLYYKFMARVVTILLRVLPRESPIVFKGADSALSLCEQVSVLGFNKVLIVTDNYLAGAGILDGIKATFDRTGVSYAIFDGVLPDPAFDQVQAGEKMLREEQGEAVIAVGGGSVLDAAKMIAMLRTNPWPLEKFDGLQKCKNAGLPLFAIPTTAGTGSEITLAAVITDPESHRKIPVADTKLIPGYVALDPVIMKGMPPGITAATGMDALTHAVESYLSRAATASSELQSSAAVHLIFKYLLRAWHNGDDMEARDGMALAAFYAGAAFSRTAVGYVHGIAHQIGRVCGTPHGNANAMLLPEVLSAYGDCVNERLAQLARRVGLDAEGGSDAELARRFTDAITAMRAEMQMPLQPKELKTEDIPGIIDEALSEAGGLYPVPRYMSRAEVQALVEGLKPA